MTRESVGVARGILRNASALFLVGLFAKAAGLVVAVLVARFLGASAMGLFALLFSVIFLLEILVSAGMTDSLVRDVAADPPSASALHRLALRLAVILGLAASALIAGSALTFMEPGAARSCLLVIAAGAPISGAFAVSQAVLQGLERAVFLVWANFAARLISLAALAIALSRGAGVEAAIASHVLFQAIALAFFFAALRQALPYRKADVSTTQLLRRSMLFAASRLLRILGIRLPSLILPAAAGLTAAGVFDAANRFSSTLGMATSASIVGLMPSFARHFAGGDSRPGTLIAYSVKYMCLGMAAISTAIALTSHFIIRFFFGDAFSAAALPLQVLAWAQVLFAMDAVLQQAMLAGGAAPAVIRHSVAGLATQFTMILVLFSTLGLPGVALAVLLGSAVALALDLRFVTLRITPFSIGRFVLAPLAAVALAAITLHAAGHLSLFVQAAVVAASWAVAIVMFRLIPKNEMSFIRDLIRSDG